MFSNKIRDLVERGQKMPTKSLFSLFMILWRNDVILIKKEQRLLSKTTNNVILKTCFLKAKSSSSTENPYQTDNVRNTL